MSTATVIGLPSKPENLDEMRAKLRGDGWEAFFIEPFENGSLSQVTLFGWKRIAGEVYPKANRATVERGGSQEQVVAILKDKIRSYWRTCEQKYLAPACAEELREQGVDVPTQSAEAITPEPADGSQEPIAQDAAPEVDPFFALPDDDGAVITPVDGVDNGYDVTYQLVETIRDDGPTGMGDKVPEALKDEDRDALDVVRGILSEYLAPSDPWELKGLEELEWYGRRLSSIESARETLKARYEAMLNELEREEGNLVAWYEPQAERITRSLLKGKKKSISTLTGTFGFRAQKEDVFVVSQDALLAWATKEKPELVTGSATIVLPPDEKLAAQAKKLLADAGISVIASDLVRKVQATAAKELWKSTKEVAPGCQLRPAYDKFYFDPPKEAKS